MRAAGDEFADELAIDGKHPVENFSGEDKNATREDCLDLHSQLEALAIGRGLSGTAEQVNARIEYLRARLLQAGYEFDNVGYEEKWDEQGNARQGYTPLID